MWRKHRRQQHAGRLSLADSLTGARGFAGTYARTCACAETVALALAHACAQADTIAHAKAYASTFTYADAFAIANAWDARGHGDR